MPKRIPIETAKAVGDQHEDVSHVVLFCWDGEKQHVVTWGRTVEDCDQAAQAGNILKKRLGWPDDLCEAIPSRVKALKKQIRELKATLADLLEEDDDR